MVDVSRWRLSAEHSTRQNHTGGDLDQDRGRSRTVGTGVWYEKSDVFGEERWLCFVFRKITVDTVICRMVWGNGDNS